MKYFIFHSTFIASTNILENGFTSMIGSNPLAHFLPYKGLLLVKVHYGDLSHSGMSTWWPFLKSQALSHRVNIARFRDQRGVKWSNIFWKQQNSQTSGSSGHKHKVTSVNILAQTWEAILSLHSSETKDSWWILEKGNPFSLRVWILFIEKTFNGWHHLQNYKTAQTGVHELSFFLKIWMRIEGYREVGWVLEELSGGDGGCGGLNKNGSIGSYI